MGPCTRGSLAAVLAAAVFSAACSTDGSGGDTEAVSATAEPPNIVVILADDLGYADVSTYGDRVQTPNIDRIGSEGAVFTQGYVTTPVCSPSRAGLLTGRYQQRFGFEYNARQAPEVPDVGLIAGVEDKGFLGSAFAARTYAEAEADLIRSIRHATVGATPPDLTGARLDGVEEALSDYRGRVVLLDFWATWCKPCIAALPKLRELAADLPADRFVLLAISVDGQVNLVTEFIKEEPMPWANWHVGMESEVTRVLDVNSYPTYILVGREREILARAGSLDGEFLSLIEKEVEGGPQA